MARKRNPGAGRPKGEPTVSVTIRMPLNMKEQFDAACSRGAGRTLTDEIIGRLRSSIEKKRDNDRDAAHKALNFLISELAREIHMGRRDWHCSPFVFRAMKVGIGKLPTP